MTKVIAIGDISGRVGREAVMQALPKLKKKHKPSLVVANCENLAHGHGITTKTVQEMLDAGVDVMTSGNHIFRNKAGLEVFDDPELRDKIVRPANYPPSVPGQGYQIIETPAGKFLIINLQGRVFMKEQFDCPFRAADKILEEHGKEDFIATIVDVHAEATSEKVCLGLYLDGRTDIVYGTHTHVPTADSRTLPKGTIYCTDIGMVGGLNSSLGVDPKNIIQSFLSQMPANHEMPEEGPVEFTALIITLNKGKKDENEVELHQEVVDIS